MSTLIRVGCETCGTIELTIGDVTATGEGYRFECPTCGLTKTREGSRMIAHILENLGCVTVPAGPITEEEIELFVERMGT